MTSKSKCSALTKQWHVSVLKKEQKEKYMARLQKKVLKIS